ncbi:MAG: methyltransferase domain-containing protein [Beijerinckiaceae bacterium]|nr:methyltransferase domain-containing protein [Beijerinckiaceae bacterium]
MLKRYLDPLRSKVPLRWHQMRKRVTRPALLGTLRRTTPLSDIYGFDRGDPVDRYYIERFLQDHSRDITGRVLEVRNDLYIQRFGRNVTHQEVIDIDADNPDATIIADLSAADVVPDDSFDCFILTQTLTYIFDTPAVLRHAYRMLRPGGVVLCTVPCLSRLDPEASQEYWRFTTASCTELFGAVFGPENVSAQSFGNILVSIGYLTGMASQEFSKAELETNDPRFPLIVTVRAVKPRANS